MCVYGFKSKGQFPNIFCKFFAEYGTPSILCRNNAKEELSEEVMDITREVGTKDQWSEPYYPNQNPVEGCAIKYLKEQSHVLMDRTGALDSTWFFAIKYLCEIHDRTADLSHPQSITPYQMGTGVTPDISAYLQFEFWEPILYLDHEESWPRSRERPGRWLGVCDHVGDALTYWVLDDQSKQVLA